MTPSTRVRLAPKAKLRHDARSGKLALLAPERLLFLNASGGAILALVDGERPIEAIAAILAERFQRPAEDLTGDVLSYLEALFARRLVEVVQP